MSEYGEMWRGEKDRQKSQKDKNKKTNSEIVLFLAGYLNFKVVQHSELHFSLFTQQNHRLDYWPSTRTAQWVSGPKSRKAFKISDIEQFIESHFK